jgi:hypothetical protein
MTIEDPRIEALKASGIPEGAYLREGIGALFKAIGEYAAPSSTKLVYERILSIGGVCTAFDWEVLTENIARAISQSLIDCDVCDYSSRYH